MSLKHILLGLLREPATGYDLKKAFDESLQHFWNAKLSQIYPSLQRMEKDGLLKSKMLPSAKGPPRRVYRRTPEGQVELQNWLRKPILADLRLHYLAQIFFMDELGELDQTHSFFLDLRQSFAQLLETYIAIERQLAMEYPGLPDVVDPEIFYPYLTLRYGTLRLRANLTWCDDVLQQIEAHLASSRPTSSSQLQP
jgi:PadR family transcriptional regulator AphA